jgi:ribosomal protein S17E
MSLMTRMRIRMLNSGDFFLRIRIHEYKRIMVSIIQTFHKYFTKTFMLYQARISGRQTHLRKKKLRNPDINSML